LVEAHANSIGGERRPSESGAVFEVAAPAPASAGNHGAGPAVSPRASRPPQRVLGTWPRSSAADVAGALSAARAAAAAWSSAGIERRRLVLERAARELASGPDPGNLLAARIGADPSEIAPHGNALAPQLARALVDPSGVLSNPRAAEPGLCLFAPAWGELYEAPAAALFALLLLGRTVVFVSDPHAPMIADAFAAAFERADLPRGVLSVVHDDGEDALRAVFASGSATYVLGSGYPGRIRRLEKLAASSGASGFGAGVGEAARALDLRILRSRALSLRSSDDLAARAEEVERRSFGRSATFSGQLPGQLARIACPERTFSRFTEILLARLRKSADVLRPIPLVERSSADLLRRVRFLGLDENATLIFDGGDALNGSAVHDPDSGSPAPPPRSSSIGEDAILAPTVFTNVEERMRIASFGRPIPVLCLLRAGSDAEAEALASRIDRDVPAEDLALDPPE
jgi:aldehyde dehydrogenase (NAD+)